MIGVGFKKLGRTPVLKLPSSYPPPSPPRVSTVLFKGQIYKHTKDWHMSQNVFNKTKLSGGRGVVVVVGEVFGCHIGTDERP